MHATEGKIKTFLEVWYTNNAGQPVHLASLQINLSADPKDAEAAKQKFEERGLESLTDATRNYLESFQKNDYELTFKVMTAA